MNGNLFIDIACKQQNCGDERICGDTFLFRRASGNDRAIIVLSDGMGHGIKANILSTLTASMIVHFDRSRYDVRRMAEMILKSLPVCSVRKISYSTFSIADIDMRTGKATVIQHDNPASLLFRNGEPIDARWESVTVNEGTQRPQTILTASFDIACGDRIVLMSDGVTQSGLGSERYPFGWGEKNVYAFIRDRLREEPDISTQRLASQVLGRAVLNDANFTKDDISCAVVHIREARSLLMCTCPPYSPAENGELVETLYGFPGRKLVCGYHLAKLVSELTGNVICKDAGSPDPDVQPAWRMKGIELITESLTTLNKILDILDRYEQLTWGEGPAFDACRMLLESDEINMLIGLSRGNGGMYMVDEFELRRKVIRRIASVLESKFRKEVNLRYL